MSCEWIWRLAFSVNPFFHNMPRPLSMCSQIVFDSSNYYYKGSERTDRDITVFQYTFSGYGVFEAKGRRYELTPGKFFLCNHCDPDILYYYDDNSSEPWELFFVAIDNCQEAVREINEKMGYVFAMPEDSSLIKKLLAYQSRKQRDANVSLTAGQASMLAQQIISTTIDLAMLKRKNTPAARLVRMAMDEIKNNIDTAISVMELADILHVSPAHLSRTFSAETGQSISQYLVKEKVSRAAYLLRNTSLSIKELYLQMGYENGSHFARTFRKVTGVSPREYRNGDSMMQVLL